MVSANSSSILASMARKKLTSFDIGGSLAKAVFYVPKDDPAHVKLQQLDKLTKERLPDLTEGDCIYMKSCKNDQVETLFDFVRDNDLAGSDVYATGGGSVKYKSLFDSNFEQNGIKVHKRDEFISLVGGLNFVKDYVSEPTYTIDR